MNPPSQVDASAVANKLATHVEPRKVRTPIGNEVRYCSSLPNPGMDPSPSFFLLPVIYSTAFFQGRTHYPRTRTPSPLLALRKETAS
jgi:hypothetical protein